MEKKPPSWSIRILIYSGAVLLTYTAVVLFLMAVFGMPEPTTLTLSVFGAFGATQLGNVFLNGIKQRAEAKMEELAFGVENIEGERTLEEMNETYNGGNANG